MWTRPKRSKTNRSLILLICCCAGSRIGAQATSQTGARFPYPEKLTYQIEWRLVNAGTAAVDLRRDLTSPTDWRFDVKIESAGLVSRLYHVGDAYKVLAGPEFCLANASLDAQEGKKHSLSKFSVDRARRKMSFEERDLIRNNTEKKELDVVACTYEICGALAKLRMSGLEPGHSTIFPMTNGKKYSPVRIAAQSLEKITVNGTSYETTRYEAYMFDNVIYHRKGRLLIWLTNDPGHVPVQFRLQMGFPIGTVTVSLQKRELQLK